MAKPPTKEIGRPAMTTVGGGLLPWSAFIDDREYAPDVQWPRSIETYARMQTDAQLKGLLLATTLPIRRFRWELDPNGARPLVVEHVAASLNLPIRGAEPAPMRRRRRFSHDVHLAHALRALAYGHFYFEQVYEYRSPDDGGDGLLHLRKLGTRPPRTITNIMLEDDGGLKGIEQWVGPSAGQSQGLAMQSLTGTVLDRDRLVAYVWDTEDDGDWIGRSMLRACFRNWLVKDRLIRVDATKHERNAMGIPWFEVDPAANKSQIEDLAAIAERLRAGEQSGGAGPGKLSIKGVEGSLPDTIASIREHDHQMSRAFLALFFELGTSETGSRALGSEFIDFFTGSQGAVADWYRDVTQEHQIEDEVELNWGPDEQPPMLAYQREETAEMSLADLKSAVEAKLISVDPELREYVVQRWRLPRGAANEPPAPPALPPPAVPAVADPAPPAGTSKPSNGLSARRSKRATLAARLAAECRAPMLWPELARAAGSDPKNGTARRARDALLDVGTLVEREDGTLAPAASIKLPDRQLRRQPTAREVEAGIDFAAMEDTFVAQRQSLVGAVKAAQGAQVETLVAAVEAAAGDHELLADLTVEPIDVDVVRPHLDAAALAGLKSAKGEHESQVASPAQAASDFSEFVAYEDAVDAAIVEKAKGTVKVLAGALGQAASRKASAVAALPPADAATEVSAHLGSLSDAFLEEQLGGATMQSYGTGRKEYMRANEPEKVFASELLDANTCPPCTDEDGTEWDTIEESEAAYPSGGGFIGCDGGLRCRGTVVAEYALAGAEGPTLAEATEGIPVEKPTQTVDDLGDLVAQAQEVKQPYRETLDLGEGLSQELDAVELVEDDLDAFEAAAAELTVGEGETAMVIPPVKTAASAAEKLLRKSWYTAADLTDLNRASILVHSEADIPAAFAKMRGYVEARGWTLAEVENGFATGGHDGYRDLSVLLSSPEGHVTELQFHIDSLWTAKFRGGGHDLYEAARSLDALRVENGGLTAVEQTEYLQLKGEMKTLYDTAYNSG